MLAELLEELEGLSDAEVHSRLGDRLQPDEEPVA